MDLCLSTIYNEQQAAALEGDLVAIDGDNHVVDFQKQAYIQIGDSASMLVLLGARPVLSSLSRR